MRKLTLHEEQVVLSPLFELPLSENVIDYNAATELEEIKLIKEGQLFFLANTKGNLYLINATIKAFLEAFKSPNTLQQVTSDFALQAQCELSQIQEIMLSFFEEMYHQGILIEPNYATEISEMVEQEPINHVKFSVGDSLGNYDLLEPLSVHGYTKLFLSSDKTTKQKVVLKILVIPEALPEELRVGGIKKFRQEFAFMKQLKDHKGICQLIHYSEAESYPFAALEYIEGWSTRGYILKNEITLTEKINLFGQMLDAIAFVQNNHILHGDIHLSNFIITADCQVKLIDFGMSNNDEPKENEIIKNGGVYQFIPPERIKISAFSFSQQRADYQSEVFQMGVILYFMLYEKFPFSGFTWEKMAKDILEKELTFDTTTKAAETIPTAIIELLDKTLQKNPEHRFKNVQELLEVYKEQI